MIANAADFLALAGLRQTTVKVRGQVVNVREMTVAERAKLLELAKEDSAMAPVFLVRCCTLGEDGQPLFSEKDAAALAATAPAVIDAVASAVMKLSGMEGDHPNA